MQRDIIDRHFNLGEEQVETIHAALDKLEKYSPRPVQSVKVTLTHEAGRFSGDMVIYLKNNEFRASADAFEPEQAVAEMVDNLRKQLSKYKGKISGKQKGEEGGLGKAMLAETAPLSDDETRTEGFVLRDLNVEDAKEIFAGEGKPFLVFRNVATSRVGVIYRRDDGGLGHMEAAGE